MALEEEKYTPGNSGLELLPVELLQKILFAASLNADCVPLDCVARSLQGIYISFPLNHQS
jgi:hypothetical protein